MTVQETSCLIRFVFTNFAYIKINNSFTCFVEYKPVQQEVSLTIDLYC